MFAAAGVMLASCSFLDVEPTIMNPGTFYSTENELRYGLASVYGVMGREDFYGQSYSLKISNADDLCYQNRGTVDVTPEYYNIGTSDETVYKAWTTIYEGIKNANAFMVDTRDSKLDKNHIYWAEAKFLRAYYHFLLAQAWGDVPLKTKNITGPGDADIQATKQEDVLKWCVAEMEDCANNYFKTDSVALTPSRVTLGIAEGILARVYLFMAGATVEGLDKTQMYTKAAYWAKRVIDRDNYKVNPDYSKVFINMIMDKYDIEYRESMWEVEFFGDRSAPDKWTNGRIGDVIGLQSNSNKSNFSEWNCNYSYALFNASLKLWYLYWKEDMIVGEKEKPNRLLDARLNWNIPVYNYAGNEKKGYLPSIHKTPYSGKDLSSKDSDTYADSTILAGMRNVGKWRREGIYEGRRDAKMLCTAINFPILRFTDVLLMYAEADNELNGPTQGAYNCVKRVRDRAKIATFPFEDYDKDSFRTLIRNERGRELAFESLRKYDLIRWGTFVNDIRGYSSFVVETRWGGATAAATISALMISRNVQPKHIYLPIPAKELSANKLLRQNPAW